MTINELIERLEEYRQEIGGDAEVRLMTQSNWPFEYGIQGLASRVEINEAAADGSDEDPDDLENDGVLFIVEGQQLCYGAKEAWKAAH
jgi:hypothetical protein